MSNRTLLILLAIAFFIVLTGAVLLMINAYEQGALLFQLGFSLINLLALILFVKNGSFIKTSYFTVTCVCFLIIIIGSFFKISHWPGSIQLLTTGLLSVPLIYTVWYVKKSEKKLLDLIKLLWVIAAFTSSFLVIVHLAPKEIRYIPDVIMFTGVIMFMILCYRDRELLKK